MLKVKHMDLNILPLFMYACVRTCTHMHAHVEEDGVRYLSQSVSTLRFESGSVTNPVTCQLD